MKTFSKFIFTFFILTQVSTAYANLIFNGSIKAEIAALATNENTKTLHHSVYEISNLYTDPSTYSYNASCYRESYDGDHIIYTKNNFSCVLYVPINLPEGTKISGLDLKHKSNNACEFSAALYSKKNLEQEISVLRESTNSNHSTDTQTLNLIIPSPLLSIGPVTMAEDTAYTVRIQFSYDDGSTSHEEQQENCAYHGMKLSYSDE